MYTREEASRIRQEFWKKFGQYMAPVRSAEGEKINWVNYRTGLRSVNFKLEAGAKEAYIRLTVSHEDHGLGELYFDQLLELQNYFRQVTGEGWEWYPDQISVGYYGYVENKLSSVGVFDKDNWPVLISFFRSNLIDLDKFWSDASFTFQALEGKA